MIVDAARRAPSGGNVQPWRFEASDDEIRFFMIPERTSPWDVAYRATYVGIGAALFNARVQAASLKKLGPVKLFPQGRPSHHVASLQLGSSDDVAITPLPRISPESIVQSPNRQAVPNRAETVATLTRGVEREGAQLHFANRAGSHQCRGELLAASDRLRFLLPTVHKRCCRRSVGRSRRPG